MLAALGRLSAEYFEKGAQEEKRLLKYMREWWNSNRSAVNTNPHDLHLKA